MTANKGPFLPCPLCGADVNLVQENSGLWYIECPGCGLFFGLPNGYSSRIYMARDWNKRAHNEDWPNDE